MTIGTTGDSGTITEPQSVLPIAVGGAVGGLVVLLIIIILIIIFLLLIFKGKRKKKIDRDEGEYNLLKITDNIL